ncbi:MAG TPA: hypothetical protein DCM60_07115 [Nitrospina sp.]|nr:hypothetical protein [Nitrospina sp.]|tara:strand:- start:152 stop:583 length:432 start_codon:yes stop_codon:yes gene_type:complete
MKILSFHFRFYLFPIIFCFFFLFLFLQTTFLQAQDGSKVEIIIKNSTYEVKGGVLKPDLPATIVIRNMDNIIHGFTSPLLEKLDVRVDTKGGTTYGKGIKGVYIEQGETVKIYFTPLLPGKFSFSCDLHPSMKGELLLITIVV